MKLSEKMTKVVIGVSGFVAGIGAGIGGTMIFNRKKKDKKLFNGKTFEELKFEHNRRKAEKKAKKEAEKAEKAAKEKKEESRNGEPPKPSETPAVNAEWGPVGTPTNHIPNWSAPEFINEDTYLTIEPENYEKIELDYYLDDDTYALGDAVVYDTLEFMGEDIANLFHATNVSTINRPDVFVRNAGLGRDYHIIFHFGSYSEEVLGIDPDADVEPDNVRYGLDDEDENEDEDDGEFVDPLLSDDEPDGGFGPDDE